MSKYFSKRYELFGGDIYVKVDLSNYATKSSSFALKANLAILKTQRDKLDIDVLAPDPVDLSKLSDAVKNDAVYDKLDAKVNNIDTSDFVLKTKYDKDKSEVENKIPNTSDLVKKLDYNAKILELEDKIPDVSSLATKKALTAV